MLKLRIADGSKTGPRDVELSTFPAVIGRRNTCAVVLPDIEVSKQHAQIEQCDGKLVICDLESGNSTFVNGRPLAPRRPVELRNGDEIRITRFAIAVSVAGEPPAPEEQTPIKNESSVALNRFFDFKQDVRRQLLAKLKLRRTDVGDTDDADFRRGVKEKLDDILDVRQDQWPANLTREELARELMDDILGLGPIEDALRDPAVTEIMVNRPDQIYVEKSGKLHAYSRRFYDDEHVLQVIQKIIQPIGRRVDESSPYVDARLKDGSRVHAIIPPLAVHGPTLTIRRFSEKKLTADDLLTFGSVDERMVRLMDLLVKQRANIVVSGGTGSGKTTLLNVLSNFIPDGERIITVEDLAELRLNKEHVVSLEARPPNIEGKGAVTIRDLVRNTLRMRPDRIVVGECRGGEALDMLQAMNTGHDGSLTTVHANSPRDTLGRLETLVMMAQMDLPSRAIREQISCAVNFIIQTARMADGSRKVTHITEVAGMEADIISSQDIFLFRQTGFDDDHRVVGRFAPTGDIPRFVERLTERGIAVDMGVFSGD